MGTSDVQLELDDSFGLAGQMGADWKISDGFYFNTAAWYVDIDTEAIVKVDGVTATTVDVQIDPWVVMAGFTWRF